MKSVFLLFDTLMLQALECYGGTHVPTPNFNRLADKGICFDKHYVGSLPCMPARRDFHTGRLNFMHRGWGPFEPFDNSWPKLFEQQKNMHTHIITDHDHYFEEGGLGYCHQFSTFEYIRGQESDRWKAIVDTPTEKWQKKFHPKHYPVGDDYGHPEDAEWIVDIMRKNRRYHMSNCEYMEDEQDHCTPRCFARALDFLNDNHNSKKDWLLWLECFDPHEPFQVPARFLPDDDDGLALDWPFYNKTWETEEEKRKICYSYYGLVAMVDEYLGKMLDFFDEHNMWDNMAVVMTTDHGFLLNEHEWWAKMRQPYYEEIAHIPLIIYHPKYKEHAGTRRSALTQTPDIMPTMLDLFDIEIPPEVQGKSLVPVIENDEKIHDAVMLGAFGGPIGVTDGRYFYYRFPVDVDPERPQDYQLHQYTVIPIHMKRYYSDVEFNSMEHHGPFDFTKNIPLLKFVGDYVPQITLLQEDKDGSRLYDLQTDPKQKTPIFDGQDTVTEKSKMAVERLKKNVAETLRRHDSPKEIYTIYGLEEPV